MKSCPNYSTTLTANKGNSHYVFKARCKQWSCEYCARLNKNVWRARIMGEVESDNTAKDWYFWTLTLLGKDHKGLKHSLQKWRENWSKLRKRIVRDLGKLRYVRVFEEHKNGTLHIHMLCDKSYSDCETIKATGKAKQRRESVKLRKHLNELGLGYIHDIKVIVTTDETGNGTARNVSAYVVKYLTKDIQSNIRIVLKDSGTRLRMIQTSHKWFNETKKDTTLDWTRVGLSIETYLNIPQSGSAYDLTRDMEITYDDFYEHEWYPNRTSDLVEWADEENGESE